MAGRECLHGIPRTVSSHSLSTIVVRDILGRAGLDYLYRSLGKWEILDYEDAVKWLTVKTFC